MTHPPSVLSVSWGGPESGYDITRQMAANVCFQKLGLAGISILTASGDEGTGKQGSFIHPCKKFDPLYPASSPYVTAVGATYLQKNKADGADLAERGWSSSGGGFSAVFSQPAYQRAVVQRYVKSNKLPAQQYWNASGRATPDISAVGTCYSIVSGSKPLGTLSGTSASTPTFAGLISVINDMRVAAGKPTLGFLNPVIYIELPSQSNPAAEVS
eukprot:NODE_971_length_1198_cov_299.946910_g736_i0.p1 GENE.NODE_971_length_1198_cov_299.946910_g736_i0~~NODE_971_length_1198_cov_299.946910_g736_i0.p1  ORF type:complete len:214 (-),score=24.80 NODE_971_length_1198_cov_299.946910_g736_i0:74-715(-)